MRILFVINSLYTRGNGLAASARRTILALRTRGHEVRVLSASPRSGEESDLGNPHYPLPPQRIPLLDPLIRSQGYAFARPDRVMIDRALSWAQVVHLEEPFRLQMMVAARARVLGVPCLGTYHIHPENLTFTVHLGWVRPLNEAMLRVWKRWVFDRCALVQCPSASVEHRLKKAGFRAPLLTLSNGVKPLASEVIREEKKGENGVYRLLVVGRYSREKDQECIVRALRYSAYADRIQLTLAGKGPREKVLRRRAESLLRQGVITHPVRFAFLSPGELSQEARRADLYIHAARIEVEGLSALEVLREGVVPVIARAPLSATSQFARSSDSVYEAGDARALGAAIDAWLSMPRQRREEEANRYRVVAHEYDFEECVAKLEEAYQQILLQ